MINSSAKTASSPFHDKTTDGRYVYILESLQIPRHFYVGVTQDLENRLAEHNAGKSLHTSKHLPWKIATAIYFANTTKAYAFEKYLKSGSGRAFSKKHF